MIKHAVGMQFLSRAMSLFVCDPNYKKSNEDIADLLINAKKIYVFDDEESAFAFCSSYSSKIPFDRKYGHAYSAEYLAPVFEIEGDFDLGIKHSLQAKDKSEISYYIASFGDEEFKILKAKFPENRSNRKDIDFTVAPRASCVIL